MFINTDFFAFKGMKSRALVTLAAAAVIVAVFAASAAFMDRIAKQQDFEDVCSGINRMPDRNVCYFDLAGSLKNTAPCESIADNEALFKSCLAKVSISAVDKLGCEKIKDDKVRSYCLAKVAAFRAELPICENIDDKDWKDVCYFDVAEATNKSEICGNIALRSFADTCFDTLAKKINYGAGCVFIIDGSMRDRCFLAVAVSTKNADLCNELGVEEFGWTCFQRIAKGRRDPGVCELIHFKPVVESCKREVNEYLAATSGS